MALIHALATVNLYGIPDGSIIAADDADPYTATLLSRGYLVVTSLPINYGVGVTQLQPIFVPSAGLVFADGTVETTADGGGGGSHEYALNALEAGFGISNANVSGQGAKINALLASLSDGQFVYFPRGIYRCNDTGIVFPSAKVIFMIGEGWDLFSGGTGGTTFYFPTDLGAGVFACDVSIYSGLRDLGFLGPNQGPALGAQTMLMPGIRVRSKASTSNVRCTGGFFSSIEVYGDHTYHYDFKGGSGNYFGRYYRASQPSVGDHHWINCDFSGTSFAAKGIADTGKADGDFETNCHDGFSPYGTVFENNAGAASSMQALTSISSPTEAIGNAWIWDSSGTQKAIVKSCRWRDFGFPTVDATYRYTGGGDTGLKRGVLDVKEFQFNLIELLDYQLYPQAAPGTTCWFYVGTTSNKNLFMQENMSFSIKAFAGGGGWFGDTGGRNMLVSTLGMGPAGLQAADVWEIWATQGTAPVAGKWVVPSGDGNFCKLATNLDGLEVIGITQDDASTTNISLVRVTGVFGVTSDSAIAAGQPVTIDNCASFGRVKQRTNTTERIVGSVPAASSGGATAFVALAPSRIPIVAKPLVSKNADYPLVASDEIVTVDASGAARTATLPTAVGVTGKTYLIKKIDSSGNAVHVQTTSAQTLDGAAPPRDLTAQWQFVRVVSDGSNWLVI